ncbi:MAG: ester cyclase [Acidobacteriota bacterium]
MTSNEYPTLMHRWFEEVWNQQKTETIRELMTEDTVHHGLSGPGGPPVHGIEPFEKFHSDFLKSFPDLHVEVEDVLKDGDRYAARFAVTGTQKGEFTGLPATGKKVVFAGSGICLVEDGKFKEVWNVIDFVKMQYDLAPDTPDVK